MGGTRNKRPKVVGVMIIAALTLGTTGVSTAGAASNTAAPVTSSRLGIGHTAHATNAAGTYEWFVNGSDDGQITLAGNNTWTSASFSDNGTWLVSGTTIALSDTQGGPQGGTLMGKVSKHGLSTAKKPGSYVYSSGTAGGWYAVKL